MFVDRRKHPRFKLNVPVEVHAEGSETPIHFTTSDLSLGGCYIESMYPFPVGTVLDLKLQLVETVIIAARVVTADPQFGNGIQFLRMLAEDRDELSAFLDKAATQTRAASAWT
jgi:c-di-GMP-binding flagellar brake protein YcgR